MKLVRDLYATMAFDLLSHEEKRRVCCCKPLCTSFMTQPMMSRTSCRCGQQNQSPYTIASLWWLNEQ
jgi:hypothetical protein